MDKNLFIKQLQENSHWYMFLGISMIALGTLAVIFAGISTLFSVIYLGIFLVISGIFEGIQAFKLNKWNLFFLHVALSILYIVGGAFIISSPGINAINLTLLLAIFFVISGIWKLFFVISHDLPHKNWLALNAILTIILGILIWYQWPYSGLWVIGTFVGIDIIMTGWTWIMLSLGAKKISHDLSK